MIENIELNDNEIIFSIPVKSAYDKLKNNQETIKEALSKIGFEFLNPVVKLIDNSQNTKKDTIASLVSSYIQQQKEEEKLKKEVKITNSKYSFYNKNKEKPIEMDIATALTTFEELKVMVKGEIYFLE
ncbi:Uncharacterised protein [Mycoplasmopsis arginini]|nr:Uncharacterised protein [Chlamydia abortus]SGA17224.1 Uncharacterised protein [Mycoplasmopsis arginini]SGA21305.1 Uncharacterised protein [Mycoplasmopsis arginini]SGA32836.1 Uncharacterised protein [Chlamydia abortus]